MNNPSSPKAIQNKLFSFNFVYYIIPQFLPRIIPFLILSVSEVPYVLLQKYISVANKMSFFHIQPRVRLSVHFIHFCKYLHIIFTSTIVFLRSLCWPIFLLYLPIQSLVLLLSFFLPLLFHDLFIVYA